MGSELMKRHRWPLDQLLSQLNYLDLTQSNQTPQQRLQVLLKQLNTLIHPELNKQHASIDAVVQTLQNDFGIRVSYDHSLEDVDIELKKIIQSTDDLVDFSNQLQSSDVQQQVSAILDQL